MFRLLNRLMEISGSRSEDSGSASSDEGDSPPAATLRGKDGALRGRTITIPESMADRAAGYLIFRIGRGPDNDLSFPDDTTLNPRHAALYRINGRWFCRDLDTVNGTRLGDKRIRGQSVPVPSRTDIRFGRQLLSLEYTPSGLAAVAPTERPTAAAPSAASSVRQAALSLESGQTEDSIAHVLFPPPPVPATGQPWRWVPPGESVTVKDWIIPNGMVYVGRSMRTLQGHGTEPALINPNLKIGVRPARTAARQGVDTYNFYFYGLTYADATPDTRRQYLEWLAGGRRAIHVSEQLLLLFFYGLERRLIEDEGNAASPAERALIRAEIESLQAIYREAPLFQRAAAGLLQYLDARQMIEEGGPKPDVGAMIAQPRTSNGQPLPQALEIALARMARDRVPLPADYALAWVLHDPEASGALRTAAQRCPDELKQLWLLRYPIEHPKGIKIPERKTPLRIAYRPSSPSFYGWLGVLAPGGLRSPSSSPLRQLRLDFAACCDALDPASRFVGKRPEMRHSALAAALLPPELRAMNPAVQAFQQRVLARLQGQMPSGVETEEGWTGRAFALSGRLLIEDLIGPAEGHAAQEPARPVSGLASSALGRAESLQTTVLLEGIGIAIEPDVRRGGSPYEPDETVFLARLTPDAETGEAAIERDRRLRPLVNLLAGVITDALAQTSREKAAEALRSISIPDLVVRLAEAIGEGETARFAVQLNWLLADMSRIRASRQSSAFAPLPGPARARIGALLTDIAAEVARAAARQPGVRYAGQPSPALVRRLATAYRVLGLEESSLYERLHHRTTLSTVSAGEEDLPALQSTASHRTSPTETATSREAHGRPIRLDAEAIRRKEAETARVSELLHSIFEEPGTETPVPVSSSAPATSTLTEADEPRTESTPETSATTGRLDAAHAALLTELLAAEEWSGDDFTARARAHGLLPGAALETINEAAWDLADEAALEGSDPVYVNAEAARVVLEG